MSSRDTNNSQYVSPTPISCHLVLQVTTTDGEQPDDSFDLIDVPAEMSPPATAPSQSSPIHLVGHSDDMATTGSRNSSPASPTSPISVAAPSSQTTPPLPLPSSPTSPFDGTDVAGPSSRCTRSKLDSDRQPDVKATISTAIGQGHNASNGAEGTSALPPPTPMIGAHQETRFTFGGSGRTPPLPDLRAADFFRCVA